MTQGGIMSLKDYVLRMRQQWVLIVAVTGAFFVGGILLALQPQEVPTQLYTANSQVLFVTPTSSSTQEVPNRLPALTAVDLLGTEYFHALVAEEMGVELAFLDDNVTFSSGASAGSDLLSISASSENPDLPVDAVNAAATIMSQSGPELLNIEGKIVQTASDSSPTIDVTKNSTLSKIVIPTVLGFLLGVFIAFVRAWLNNKLFSSRELSEMTSTLVLTVRRSAQKGSNLLTWSQQDLNKTRSTLLARAGNDSSVMLLVNEASRSSFLGFVGVFVQSVQATGRKTLLVDCDLRYRTELDSLNIQDEATGISSSTQKAASFQKLITSVPPQGDVVLSLGGITQPEDILSTKEFQKFIRSVQTTYDLVILLSPSFEYDPTPTTLAPLANHIAVVAETGVSTLTSVARTSLVLQETHIDGPSVIVLDSKLEIEKSKVRS